MTPSLVGPLRPRPNARRVARLLTLSLIFSILLLAAPALAGAPPTPPPPALTIQAATPQLEEHVRQIVEETAPRLAAWVGASPPSLRIEVAASEEAFKARVAQLDGPRWAAGLAVPGQGLILLRSPRQLIEPEQFRLLLAHELTHLYLSAAMRQREHPLWLEEGLAMYASGEGGWERAAAMAQAVWQGRLLSLAELEHAFPEDPEQAALAYAQSYYLVAYLLRQHGPEALPKIIASLARGRPMTAALYEATGQGLYSLERGFQEEMNSRFSWLTAIFAGGSLWVLVSVVAAFALVARRRAHKQHMAAMPDGDEHGGALDMRRRWPPATRPRIEVAGWRGNGGAGESTPGAGQEEKGGGKG